jgi:uncharacterized membrane protein
MMWWLNRTRLARSFDHDRIKRAIEDAEQATSGTIVVSVAPYFIGSVRRAAEIAFKRLGVVQSQHRNGVLFFIVPGRRQFVVLGDVAIHHSVGPNFWEAVAQCVSARFRAGDMNGGLVDAIHDVAQRLAEHFPREQATGDNA